MYYYKFRVYFDEVEDFVRDVELLATDNFESFHKLLYDCIGLNGNELASFSICDTKWNKQKEITLIDMGDDEVADEHEDYEENDSFSTKSNIPKFLMSESVIKDFITNPHQYIIYEYDFLNPKIFYIELLKTLTTDSADGFPRCTFKEHELPKKAQHLPKSDDPIEAELLDLHLDDDDDDLFADGYSDEDRIEFDSFDEFKDF